MGGARWLAENHDWVKATVQEALDDPRPVLTEEEMDRRFERLMRKLETRYGA